jgi:hypothetical protein
MRWRVRQKEARSLSMCDVVEEEKEIFFGEMVSNHLPKSVPSTFCDAANMRQKKW